MEMTKERAGKERKQKEAEKGARRCMPCALERFVWKHIHIYYLGLRRGFREREKERERASLPFYD